MPHRATVFAERWPNGWGIRPDTFIVRFTRTATEDQRFLWTGGLATMQLIYYEKIKVKGGGHPMGPQYGDAARVSPTCGASAT